MLQIFEHQLFSRMTQISNRATNIIIVITIQQLYWIKKGKKEMKIRFFFSKNANNMCTVFVWIFEERKGDGEENNKKLFIALYEGHSLHELRARCGCPPIQVCSNGRLHYICYPMVCGIQYTYIIITIFTFWGCNLSKFPDSRNDIAKRHRRPAVTF